MVLVHLESNQIFNLNDSAARLWELLDDHSSAEALLGALTAVYEVDRDVLIRDVDRTLSHFLRHGLVRTELEP